MVQRIIERAALAALAVALAGTHASAEVRDAVYRGTVVCDMLPFFERYNEWFLPHHFRSWLHVFAQPTPWARLAESQCILLGVALTVFISGAAAFQVRDIKS